MNLANKIEAILFFKGEPISAKKLSEILNVSKEEILVAISELSQALQDRGLCLVSQEEEYTLGTRPEVSELIESIQKEELNKTLSKASIETLSIILYKNGASRAEIDYIRGVNSGFTLRALSVRGLIEKVTDPNDARKYLYKPTFDLLQHLGLSSVERLPEFNTLTEKLNQIKSGESSNDNQ